MKLSSERFGAINIAKGEDDGTVFRNFIRESKRGPDRRSLATDAIVEMLEKGKVSPFERFRCTTTPTSPSAVHPLLLEGACLQIMLNHTAHTTIIGSDHYPVPPGAFHRAPPPAPGHRKWVPYGQPSAHIHTFSL